MTLEASFFPPNADDRYIPFKIFIGPGEVKQISVGDGAIMAVGKLMVAECLEDNSGGVVYELDTRKHLDYPFPEECVKLFLEFHDQALLQVEDYELYKVALRHTGDKLD